MVQARAYTCILPAKQSVGKFWQAGREILIYSVDVKDNSSVSLWRHK